MKRIHWTNDMEEFLEDKWGIWSVKRLAKHFNTTECAITNKAERLKLGGAYSQYLSTTDIANMFGIARRTVLNYWILKYGLKASSNPLKTQKIYRVKHEDLIKFLKDNPDKYTTNNLELYALGEEYDWLIEKRKYDKENYVKTGEWSMQEINNMNKWYEEEGIGLKEIAKRLNRTYLSVRRQRSNYANNKIKEC